MSLHPFISTEFNNYAVDLQNKARTSVYAIVAPFDVTARVDTGAVLTAGTIIEITSIQQAINVFGSSYDNANVGMKWISYLFGVSSATKIYATYLGRRVQSATIDNTLNGAHVAGATTVTLADSTGFLNGAEITIGTGATKEVRRILSTPAANAFTVTPLDFDHSTGEDVKVIDEVTVGNYATCRTALNTYKFDMYVEDSFGATQIAATKAWLVTREATGLYSRNFFGNKYGQTKAALITESQTNNYKRMRFIYGDIVTDGRHFEGNTHALVAAANYMQKVISGRLSNTALISVNTVPYKDVTAIYDSENNSEITIGEANTLVDGNVCAAIYSYVLGNNAVRFHKCVTSYNKDGNALPSTTYSNIVDDEVEIYMADDISFVVDEYLAERVNNTAKLPMTDKADDLNDLQGVVQARCDSYVFLNNDQNAVEVLVTYDNLNDQIQIDVSYTAVKSGDRVNITLYKQTNV